MSGNKSDLIASLKYYRECYGNFPSDEVNVVISKRKLGGGYARNSALYLGGLTDDNYRKNKIDYLRYISHELAHNWWNGADLNMEDWLN